MALLDMLQQKLTLDMVAAMARQAGLDPRQVEGLLPSAIALVTSGLAKQSAGGAQQLSQFLDSDGDGIPDALEAASGSGMARGKDMLGQIFGDKTGVAESALGRMSGAKGGEMGSLLAMLAPLVLKSLASAKRTQGLSSTDLSDLLGREATRAQGALPKELSGLSRVLDADGDGSVLDDLAGIAQKGLLGGLFGRR